MSRDHDADDDPATDAAAFRVQVKLMRQAQAAYFRDRSPTLLDEARRIERRVDAAIKAHDDRQRRMF